MAGTQRQRGLTDERLDQLGRVLVRASAADHAEAEAVASSPFLYARLRARINAEAERREAGESWRVLLGVFWRSAPAMALVAAFAFLLFWTATSPATLTPGVLSDEAFLGTPDAGFEHVVFAERNPLSNDEVLATILDDEEREASR
ncbi:MAG TPA: hypothetical protein VFS10_12765 [Pyrinomonadaceae bacterium]|nr:hypothetical protein [Pyrinomonadaceae bacterium]